MSDLQQDLSILMGAAEAMPQPTEIANVLTLLSKGSTHEQLFFEKLNDPAWLPVLDELGLFSSLPSGKSTDDGKVTYPYHLPLVGLTKLAPTAPQAVTSILAKLDLPDNPAVGDQVLHCISLIREPACIPVLHAVLVKLAEKANTSSWVWIHQLLGNWIELKAFQHVLVVLNSFLRDSTGPKSNSFRLDDAWAIQQVDELALEPLMRDFSLEIATILFNALCRFGNRDRAETERHPNLIGFDLAAHLGGNGAGAYWFEDFRSETTYREAEGILARRLYAASEQIYKKGDIGAVELLDQLLRSNSWKLFHRLRWQLYADFPDLSSKAARKDVLERIPFLNRFDFEHCHEFAQFLVSHAGAHKEKFLSALEVNQFFDVVMTGPIDKFVDKADEHFKDVFRRKQLWPISSLLQGERLEKYNVLCPESRSISVQSYKPFRTSGGEAHFVKHVPPPITEELLRSKDQQLWDILNNWKPKERDFSSASRWEIEDYGALAQKFAEVVEKEPSRFTAKSGWWQNLTRPEPATEVLARGTQRIKNDEAKPQDPPTAENWANWFGIAEWVLMQSAKDQKKDSPPSAESGQPDWHWASTRVLDFLEAAIRSDYCDVDRFADKLEALLKDLVKRDDPRLDGKSDEDYDDWFTIAINSVRGTAIGAILALALRQMNREKQIQPWIFDFLSARLQLTAESPAVFAAIGARLRLFAYLFKDKLEGGETLLFPKDRPVHQRATILSHFCYDAPMTDLLAVFPNLIDEALLILKTILDEETDEKRYKHRRDYGSQVGVHICFYYWNSAFPDDKTGEKELDRFFILAPAKARALTIAEIARIFEKPPAKADTESEKRFKRVQHLWDRRFNHISEMRRKTGIPTNEFEAELGNFLEWLKCECFAFEWRFTRAVQAIDDLQKLPHAFHLLETLCKWNEQFPERLNASLHLLEKVLSKPNEQLRWSIQTKKLAPLLSRGLSSQDAAIQLHASECKDLLLKLGLFEFLNVGKIPGAAAD